MATNSLGGSCSLSSDGGNNYSDVDNNGEFSLCGCGGPEADGASAPVVAEYNAPMPVVKGSGLVDLSTGAVRLGLAPPAGVPYDPRQILVYNSRNTATSENGRGVTGSLNVKIIEIDADTVDVVNGLGEKVRFGYRDGTSNIYRSPPGSTSTLIMLPGSGVGSGWDDIRGNQQIVLQPNAQRTTYVWDFENQNALVQRPTGTRVTMAYNADNRRVERNP